MDIRIHICIVIIYTALFFLGPSSLKLSFGGGDKPLLDRFDKAFKYYSVSRVFVFLLCLAVSSFSFYIVGKGGPIDPGLIMAISTGAGFVVVSMIDLLQILKIVDAHKKWLDSHKRD